MVEVGKTTRFTPREFPAAGDTPLASHRGATVHMCQQPVPRGAVHGLNIPGLCVEPQSLLCRSSCARLHTVLVADCVVVESSTTKGSVGCPVVLVSIDLGASSCVTPGSSVALALSATRCRPPWHTTLQDTLTHQPGRNNAVNNTSRTPPYFKF